MFSSHYLRHTAAAVFVRGAIALGVFSPALASAAGTGALQAQVQDLAKRLEKLEAKTLAPADLVGTYATTAFQSELVAASPWKVRSYVFDGTITLKADGKYSGKTTDSGSELTSDGVVNFFSQDETTKGKWKLNGSKVDLGGMKLYVVGTGELLVGSSANPEDNTNVVLLLTRMPD